MRGKRLRFKGTAVVLLIATLVPLTSSACFGRFALTRKVYGFNRDLSSDRWVRWIGFLVMNFVPIYGAAGAIDLVFANSVEFWGGSNPFALREGGRRYAVGPDGSEVRSREVAPGELELRIESPDGTVRTLRLVQEAGELRAQDAEDRVLARMRPDATR